MAALSSLDLAIKVQLNAKANVTRTGLDVLDCPMNFQPTNFKFLSSIANAALGGADQMVGQVLTITANTSTSFDLTSFTDLAARTGTSLARLKGYLFCLLSTSLSNVGNACSSVTIGNAGGTGTNGNKLNLGAATSTFTLANGELQLWLGNTASGVTVDSTHKLIGITNNDALVDAKLLIAIPGGTS